VFSQIGPGEIILVLAIALIVLGPKRLPSAARSVGRGLREFKQSLTEADPRAVDEDDDYPEPDPAPAPAPKPEPAKTTTAAK
jgi:sec-independent protein translocase protein TatA